MGMTAEIRLSTEGWNKKSLRVRNAIKAGAQKAVLAVAQDIFDKTSKKLEGPQYGYHQGPRGGYVPNYPEGGGEKGKIPIPRLTGNLARSLKMTPLTPLAVAIWSDPRIAKYAKWVHDGAKGRPPRRYLKDTFDEREAAGRRTMQSMINAAIRDAQ